MNKMGPRTSVRKPPAVHRGIQYLNGWCNLPPSTIHHGTAFQICTSSFFPGWVCPTQRAGNYR
jgi:hypothetical protein